MNMQEPEQWQSSRSEWQEQSYGAYRAEDMGVYEQQKIHPQDEKSLKGTVLMQTVAGLSWLGFFMAIPGIVGAALVLKNANGKAALVTAGVMGLVSSILVLVVLIAIFVLSVVAVTRRGMLRKK